MGATLLCELGLFLLCTLLCSGHAQDAVLTIEPNWSSFFIGEFIVFKCDMNEGKDTDWNYKIKKNGQDFILYSDYKEHRLRFTSTGDSGEYQCFVEMKISRDTKKSNTVSVTVLADKPRATLTAGTTIIPVGGSVTLTCSVNSSSSGWKYYWYRDENSSEPLTTQDAVFPSDGQIRVSQEGLYRCRGGRGNPVYYTEDSETVSIDKNSVPGTFLSPLIVGLICGVLLIFLLLLLLLVCRFKQSKDSFFVRTQSTNQSSAMNHIIKDEAQRSQHASTLQGDACVYESIKDLHDTQNDDSVLYAEVSHDRAKTKKHNDDSLLYAQVYYTKAKPKRQKGKPAPAAADETVYSEVKSQTALGNCAGIK